MGFTEPDTPPTTPGQMPQANTSGPAPAPYTGPDQGAGIITYAATGVSFQLPGVEVMDGVDGSKVQESGYAHDVNAGLVTDYHPGAISLITVGGDADAGGRDDVADSVAGAVANSEARYLEHEGDTHGTGNTIGDLMTFPPSPLDPGAGPGLTDPAGHYYDPPRAYGGNEPA
jgi:hypothetical protein